MLRTGTPLIGLLFCALQIVASAQQPSDFETLLAMAQQAQARSDFQTAANLYARAVTLRPEIPELRANLGLMYYQVGSDELAKEAFRHALRQKPSLFVPSFFLGLESLKGKQFGEAIEYLKQADRKKPNDIQVQLGLGQAYAGAGKAREATSAYSRATQFDPGNADAWYHLGVSYLELVEADARTLLIHHKDSAYVQTLMAETFADLGAFIQADDAYKKAVASPNPPPNTHAAHAFVLLNRNELAAAEREIRAEIAENPGSLVAKLGMARIHLEQDAATEAAQEIEATWKADSGFVRANVVAFNARLPRTRRQELVSALERSQLAGDAPQELVTVFRDPSADSATSLSGSSIASVRPPKANAPVQSASKLYASGRYADCSDALASPARPLGLGEFRLLASCSFLTGEYARARDAAVKLASNPATEAEGLYWETKSAQKLASQVLARASAADPNSPKLHVLLGDVYRGQKAFPDAEKEYRKALDLRPEDSGALFGLSLALFSDGKNDEALNIARAALAKNPNDPELNAVMGELLCAGDDFVGAEPYLKKSLNTKPEFISRVHVLLGKVYAKTDRTQQAIEELKLGLPSDKDGSVHYQIARLYLKTGDRTSAMQAFAASKQLQEQGLMHASVAMQQGQENIDLQ